MDVTFTPRFAGTRYGGVALENYSEDLVATGYLQGTGIGAEVNFLPATASAVAAPFYKPYGVALDGDGNIYLAEPFKNRVVKETPTADGYSQSTVVSYFNTPSGIAVDGAGYIYVAGVGGPGILKVALSTDKHEESRVGPGNSTSGVAVDGSGDVYFSMDSSVYKETPSGDGYSQSTVASNLGTPEGIAVDGQGNVFVAGSLGNRVLKETPSVGGYIQSKIGSGLNAAAYVAVDGRGNVFISDIRNDRILEETPGPHGYTQSTVPTGPVYTTLGIAVDASGSLYIAEPYNPGTQVLKVDFRDPPSLTFTAASNGPQAATLENIGNASLDLPILDRGENPALSEGFTLIDSESSACPVIRDDAPEPGKLAPNSSCNLQIGVAPGARGSFSGTLTLTDSDLNAAAPAYSTQTVILNVESAKGSTRPER